jgi:ribosome-associated heat shock protein Hsp15
VSPASPHDDTPTPPASSHTGVGDTPVRLDVWLDVACLFKTRSAAQTAIKGGKVDVNGQRGKQNRDVRPGDTIAITRPMGRKQQIVVRGTATQHLAKAEARTLLYEDVTPPPTPEEQAFLQLLRDTRPRGPVVAPDRRERRELRRLKGRI